MPWKKKKKSTVSYKGRKGKVTTGRTRTGGYGVSAGGVTRQAKTQKAALAALKVGLAAKGVKGGVAAAVVSKAQRDLRTLGKTGRAYGKAAKSIWGYASGKKRNGKKRR